MPRQLAKALVVLTLCLLGSLSRAQTPSGGLRVKKFVAPAYPAAARENRMQGTTITELQVRADGTIGSVKVVDAAPVFHDYVEAALKQWVFDPIPQPATLRVTVKFFLDSCGKAGPHQEAPQLFGETLVQADLPETVEIRTCLKPIITNVN